MSNVKSTYNFVPAPTETEVFKPTWADQVSHDIPFSDGESGEIELKITAKTPIFIRNGHSKKDKELFDKFQKGEIKNPTLAEKESIKNYLSFYNFNGEYMIPATSIKGMIRSVLEIISFSRISQMDRKFIYGLRDMNNDKFSKTEIRNNQTGWLIKTEDGWVIKSCESDRVRVDSIKGFFDVKNLIEGGENLAFNQFAAVEKYKKTGIRDFNKLYQFNNLIEIDKTGNVYSLTKEESDIKGHLVMYGSINNKKYDYIFHEPNSNSIYKLEKNSKGKADLLERILDIEKDNKDSLWHYFIDELKLTKIPVFFKIENGKVKHFGFSKLYRLNNGHYLNELEPLKSYLGEKTNPEGNKFGYDLASLIFGHTENEKALKGRLMVSHAKIDVFKGDLDDEERILSTPNPSYYPFYLEQSNCSTQGYNTYVDKSATLKGFKRYPLHNDIKKGDLQKDSMSSKFIPLATDNSFIFKIRFHNLKKTEIGALVSALTFHNTPDSFHSLGGGKSYGFGKVKIVFLQKETKWLDYLYFFEKEMEKHAKINLKNSWLNSSTIKELVALSQNSSDSVNVNLVYPQLELPGVDAKNANEFNNIKKAKEYLKPFSTVNKSVILNSTISVFEKAKKEGELIKKNEAVKIMKVAKNQLEQGETEKALETYKKAIAIFDDNSLLEFEKEIRSKEKEKEESDAYNLAKATATSEAYLFFVETYPLSINIVEIQQLLAKLKATSGIPERLTKLTEFEKFFKEGSQWVNRLPNKSLADNNFEDEVIQIVLSIAKTEVSNSKKTLNWTNGNNQKKLETWFGIEKIKEFFVKLNIPNV